MPQLPHMDEGTDISAAVGFLVTGDNKSGIGLVRYFHVRVPLPHFQFHIVERLVVLDQSGFHNEGFGIAFRAYE
jgi:hypothetical protein